MYDKLREQLKMEKLLLQRLKRGGALNSNSEGKIEPLQFDDVVRDVLESFVSPQHIPIDIKGLERATLIGLLTEAGTWMKRRTKTHKDTDNFLVTVGGEPG